MENTITTRPDAEIIEQVVIGGDLSKLSPDQRVSYYNLVCRSLNINPLTRPFDYITLNGKLTLYAKKDATDQLRARDGISIVSLDSKTVNDIYLVTARATTKDGRSDAATGAVNIAGLKGDALANALMKAETKAKRRVTLSICGMGLLDETEIETIPDARVTVVDDAGEIKQEQQTPIKWQPGDPLTLEQAEAITNHQGVRYGDLDDDKLKFAHKALLAKSDPLPEHIMKIAAIELILRARAGNAA